MPIQTFSQKVTADTTVTTTSETIALTLNGISTADADTGVSISGHLIMTAGTSATAITVRIRRGTTTSGTVVNEANAVTVSGGNVREQTFYAKDTPGAVANQQYVVTVQQTAATGDGTVSYISSLTVVGAQ